MMADQKVKTFLLSCNLHNGVLEDHSDLKLELLTAVRLGKITVI